MNHIQLTSLEKMSYLKMCFEKSSVGVINIVLLRTVLHKKLNFAPVANFSTLHEEYSYHFCPLIFLKWSFFWIFLTVTHVMSNNTFS